MTTTTPHLHRFLLNIVCGVLHVSMFADVYQALTRCLRPLSLSFNSLDRMMHI